MAKGAEELELGVSPRRSSSRARHSLVPCSTGQPHWEASQTSTRPEASSGPWDPVLQSTALSAHILKGGPVPPPLGPHAAEHGIVSMPTARDGITGRPRPGQT